MSARFSEADLVGADLVVLLTIDYAGQTWRFSSRPVDMTDADGNTWQYVGGLDDLDVADEMDLFSTAPAQKSVAVAVEWPVDVAELVALGHDLGAATGELSIARDDDPIEARVVLVVGSVVDPEYGDPDAPNVVNFSLDESPWEDGGSVLDDDAVVKAGVTWTASSEQAEGCYYPLVFGSPGETTDADGASLTVAATPALVAGSSGLNYWLVIAGHRTQAGTDGAYVSLYNPEYDEWISVVASHVEDDLGRTVTVVDGYDAGFGRFTDPWESNHSIWVCWSGTAGIQSLSRTAPVVGLGDLVELLLDLTTLRLDRGRTSANTAALNRIKVGGYVDTQGAPYDAVTDLCLPLAPFVSITASDEGLWPCVFPYDTASESTAVAHFEEGAEFGVERAGPVAYEGRADVVNEVTLSYALDGATGDYRRTRTISGDPAKVGQPDTFSSVHSRASFLRYGRKATTMSSDILCDEASADLVLLQTVMAKGLARRVVPLDCDQRWGWVEKGDVVTYTSADLHVRRQVGIVRAKAWTLTGFVSFEVVLLEDPVRDLRLGQT